MSNLVECAVRIAGDGGGISITRAMVAPRIEVTKTPAGWTGRIGLRSGTMLREHLIHRKAVIQTAAGDFSGEVIDHIELFGPADWITISGVGDPPH